VAHTDILGAQHVLLEPGSLIDVFEPDEAASRFAREVVDQNILAIAPERLPMTMPSSPSASSIVCDCHFTPGLPGFSYQ
jgi:hypothetical protein